MREKLLNAASIAIAAAVLVLTGFTLRRASHPTPLSSLETQSAPGAKAYANSGHIIGPAAAPITIVEFADFQCPFCRLFKATIDSLRRLHPGEVRVVFRHRPLNIHPFALTAALASECASDQGKFEAMFNELYGHQDSLGTASWLWLARLAGVPDEPRFSRCMARAAPVASIKRDTMLAAALGIRATPTLFINDLRIDGALSTEV